MQGTTLSLSFYSATVQMWFTHTHISLMPKNPTNVRDHTKGFCLHPELAPSLSVSVSKPPLILSLGRLLNPKDPLPSASMNGDCTNSALFSLLSSTFFKKTKQKTAFVHKLLKWFDHLRSSLLWKQLNLRVLLKEICYSSNVMTVFWNCCKNTWGKYHVFVYVALNCSAWVCASTV